MTNKPKRRRRITIPEGLPIVDYSHASTPRQISKMNLTEDELENLGENEYVSLCLQGGEIRWYANGIVKIIDQRFNDGKSIDVYDFQYHKIPIK